MTHSTLDTGLSSAIGRWKGFGPYYAMFPVDFAFQVVNDYSEKGDAILDPFAGRATSIYAAAAQQRTGCGIEINSVGWLYGQVKLCPAPLPDVLERVQEISKLATAIPEPALESLSEFFHVCYCPAVLRYLLACREFLCWEKDRTDAALMAILLVSLHGKQPGSLSNQTRQGKAMAPDYSVRWWRARNMLPPEVDPVVFLTKRIHWRYKKGVPELTNSRVICGDSVIELARVAQKINDGKQRPFQLLFTSPPYYSITDYYKDQWLRRWMLGGPERPVRTHNVHCNRFESRVVYQSLLDSVFQQCAYIMSPNATVYVRTDARTFTRQATINALRNAFPRKQMQEIPRPFGKTTQTALFGDKTSKPGEIDIILKN